MSSCLLFAYGLLQPGLQPPKTVTRQWKDRVRGRLLDLGSYPGACDLDQSTTSFAGWILEIDESELASLDEFEGTSAGLYQRRLVITQSGSQAWIYEYTGPRPANSIHLDSWPPA